MKTHEMVKLRERGYLQKSGGVWRACGNIQASALGAA